MIASHWTYSYPSCRWKAGTNTLCGQCDCACTRLWSCIFHPGQALWYGFIRTLSPSSDSSIPFISITVSKSGFLIVCGSCTESLCCPANRGDKWCLSVQITKRMYRERVQMGGRLLEFCRLCKLPLNHPKPWIFNFYLILVQRMNLYQHMEDMCMLLLRPAVLSQSLHCAIYSTGPCSEWAGGCSQVEVLLKVLLRQAFKRSS